jgi:uncharacterized protein YecT (DUF1311 family)
MHRNFGLLAIATALGISVAAASPASAQSAPASGAAPGPSFDCARASTAAEHLICGDPELSALDRGLAMFYAAGLRNPRHGRAVRGQREWLAMRNACATRFCLRDEMMDRLWSLTLSVGRGLPEYESEDADAYLIIVDLGGGWYAFGAEGIWEGPTINDAGASGAFRLAAGRGQVAASANAACAFTLTRLPRDRWRIAAHEPPDGAACGGMNATVEGTYSRWQR